MSQSPMARLEEFEYHHVLQFRFFVSWSALPEIELLRASLRGSRHLGPRGDYVQFLERHLARKSEVRAMV